MQWCELDSSGSECITFMDLCENSNEPSGFIKDENCLAMSEWPSASWGGKKNSDVWSSWWKTNNTGFRKAVLSFTDHYLMTLNWQVNIFTHQHEMVHEPKVNIECVYYSLLNLECNEEVIHHICITSREAAVCMYLLTMYNQYFSSCVFLRKNLSYDQRVF